MKKIICSSGAAHLDAFCKVLAYRDKVKLVVAGKGPADAYLKEYAGNLGIYNRVYFAGFVDDPTRNKLYKCADVALSLIHI